MKLTETHMLTNFPCAPLHAQPLPPKMLKSGDIVNSARKHRMVPKQTDWKPQHGYGTQMPAP